MPQFLTTPQGRRLAYHATRGAGPGVVFLGGFKSDMTGTKALWLQDWAERQGRAFVRFDYSGHGASGGAFVDGCIGDWAADALAVLDTLAAGPQVLVGSSMGGWIALLLARLRPERVAGLIGIAAAPDFTIDMWQSLSPDQQRELAEQGQVVLPSEYSVEGDVITHRLIADGRDHLVLTQPLALPFPVRLLQGAADTVVPVATALRLLDHATGPDIRLTVVKGADHRFSDDDCLELLGATLAEVLARA